MNYIKKLSFFFITVMITITSCVEPTDIGQELLENDFIGHGYLDDFEIQSRTERSDSLLTYFPFSPISSFFIGNMTDPFYGLLKTSFTLEAGLYRTGGGAILNSPQFTDVTLDSVVLVLKLDKGLAYGYTNERFTIDFNELETRLAAADNYYSNLEPDLKSFGGLDEQVQYFPRIENVDYLDYSNTETFDAEPDTVSLPFIRFRLDDAFGQKFIDADSLNYVTDSTLLDFFKGIQISSSSKNGGIIGFDKVSIDVGDSQGGIYVYYSNDAGEAGEYKFSFSDYRVHTGQYYHDYSHSMVEPFLENPSLGDSITFIQGLAGLNTVVTFPNMDQLQGKIVNKAELRVNVNALEGDSPFYNPPVEQIVIYAKDDDGVLREINDFSFASSLLSLQFGGTLVKGDEDNPDYYLFNISNHLQEIIDGKAPNEIYLSCYNSSRNPNRVSLYGAKHSQYPMELKVNFTDPK